VIDKLSIRAHSAWWLFEFRRAAVLVSKTNAYKQL